MFTTGNTTTRKKKKLTESEKSPTVLALLWQHDLSLKRQVYMLDKTNKSMGYRMTVGQKMVYKQFQKNMHKHDIAYARLMGDKPLEHQLRRQNKSGFRSNTNFTDDYDDDGLLKRIWHAGNTARDEYKKDKPREFTPSQMRPATAVLHNTAMYLNSENKKTKRSQSSMSMANTSRPQSMARLNTPATRQKLLDKRPATSFELSRNEDTTLSVVVNGPDGSSEATDEEDDERPSNNLNAKNIYLETGTRPKTAHIDIPTSKAESRPRTVETTIQPFQNDRAESSASKHIYMGPEHARRPKLLDLYKSFVHDQNYEQKMKKILDNMQEFRADKDRMLNDYYAVRLVAETEKDQGPDFVPNHRDSIVDAAEFRQCTGDPLIRSHTFKRVNMHGACFDKSDNKNVSRIQSALKSTDITVE